MTYQQTVLNDKPAGFWMITAASGTSETDLSGNSKTATITEATDLIDRGYRPLVTGTSTDRAYRFYSGNHKLTYPTLEIWDKGRNHIPFSVEFTVQPITSRRRVDLFAPQEASNASVPDNGIFLENGRLYFSVSNGSASGVPTVKSVASTWLSTGTTHHVVATYSVAHVSLYVDGVLAASEPVDPAITWSHTTANFITTAYSLSSDTTSSSFLFDALSVYRAELSPKSINNHYIMSTPNLSDVELVNSLGGKIIKLNDGDRTKAFEYSAKDRGWSSNLNVITDLVQNDDGSIGLKKIKPLKVYNTSTNYNNLLALNQATVETDSTGWVNQTTNIATMTRTTANALSGSGAILLDCILDGYAQALVSTRLPIIAGFTYSAVLSCKLAAGTTPGNVTNVKIQWYDEADTFISEVQGSQFTPSASWQQSVATLAAPSNARHARIQINARGLFVGSQVVFDNMGLWAGSSTNWVSPLVGQTFTPGADISTRPRNLLAYNPATAEIDAVSQIGVTGSNHTLTRSTADMYSGLASFRTESTGAGGVISITASQTPAVKVEPGRTYTTTVKYKPITTARNIQMYVNWYDSANTLIGNGGVSSVATTLNIWNTYKRTVIAPPKAVWGDFYCQTGSAAVVGEVFYWDEMGFMEGDTTQWYPPLFNINEVILRENKYALVENAGSHFGKDQGGFGFFADITALENDDVQEQVLASVSSSDGTYIIEVVKKSDKSIYLRYTYKNQSGVITTSEIVHTAISGLLATTPYFYVEWGGGLLSLYIGSTASLAQIAFDAGIPAPRFDENAYLNLGAGYDGNRPWNNNFSWLKIYNKIQPASDFLYNRTSVNGFTAKLDTTLNVSQTGNIVVQAPTGTDGSSATTQTRITWNPLLSNNSVQSSVTGTKNIVTYNQATVETDTTGLASASNCTILRSTLYRAEGIASLEATSTATVVQVGSTFGTSGVPVKPGLTYTFVASVYAPVITATATLQIVWYNSAGGVVSSSAASTPIALSASWSDRTLTVVSPAGSAFANYRVGWTAAGAGEKVYIDKMGLWEGTTTDWEAPLNTATYGSEILTNQFAGTLPGRYFAKSTISTDDSYYAPTKLNDMKLEVFADNQETAENGWDEAVSGTRPRIYSDKSPEVRQNLYDGIYVNSIATGLYLLPVNDTATTATPDGGSSASTAGPAALIRTLEFWVYPETQGYHAYYDGATEYSMRYYDSGGFTTTGFTTLYVDGASVTNGTTSATWYNRWHHIILTNASAQININTSSTAPINLLTANQSTGGDTLSSTSGIANHTGATMTYDTTQQLSGAGSIKSATITPNRHSLSTTPYPAPVTPGKTYTARYSVRAGASPTGGFGWTIYIEWHDLNNVAIVSTSGGATTTVTQDVWTTVSLTAAAPEGAHYAVIIPYRSAAAGGTTEDAWIDNWGFWEGSSSTWSAAGSKMRIGGIPVGGTQATGRYQNISYYPQTFDAGMVTTNYKAYLGDMTGGGVTDSGLSIFRNVSDSVNLLTANQASAEGGNTTGMENVTNCTSSSQASSNSQHGARIFAINATANGTVTFGAGLESTMSTCVPVTVGKSYTAFARLYSSPASRTAQVYIRWYNSAGTPLANDFSASTAIAANSWETRSVTAVAPATAAYANMRVSFPTSPLAAENYYADCLGIWEGAGVEWAPPVLTSPNPKTFNDIWTTETIKIR